MIRVQIYVGEIGDSASSSTSIEERERTNYLNPRDVIPTVDQLIEQARKRLINALPQEMQL